MGICVTIKNASRDLRLLKGMKEELEKCVRQR